MAKDDIGRNTSRIIVLYIDYNYKKMRFQQNFNDEKTSRKNSTEQTTTANGDIIKTQKQTAETKISNKKI